MIYCNGNAIGVYPVLVTFEENGEYREAYTNSPSEYETMVNSNPLKYNKFKITNIILTEEQEARLKALRETVKDASDGFSSYYSQFVEYGYIDRDAPEVMKEVLLPKYEDLTKAYLIKGYKAKLAELRYNKEIGGVEFNGVIVKSDRESQSTITSTAVMFSKGMIKSTDFKCENDQWIECDEKMFDLLAATVGGHVKICFKSESMVIEKLSSLHGSALYLTGKELEAMFEDTYKAIVDTTKPQPEAPKDEIEAPSDLPAEDVPSLDEAMEVTPDSAPGIEPRSNNFNKKNKKK